MDGARPLLDRIPPLGLLVELFVVANLAFLALDIYLAHSVNRFRAWPEWIPLVFSLAAAPALAAGLWLSNRRSDRWRPAWSGTVVGVIAVAVGVAGLILHLESQFFQNVSLKSLVYTAPLAAPLAYAGLGLVLLLNRMVAPHSLEWDRWLVLLAGAGFVGNLALALLDHAQNGFYVAAEWIPVAAAAYAVAFLGLVVVRPLDRRLLGASLVVLAVEALVGLAGFGFHLAADLHRSTASLRDDFLYGAPVFAPLLFPNLALLGALAVWDLWRKPAEAA